MLEKILMAGKICFVTAWTIGGLAGIGTIFGYTGGVIRHHLGPGKESAPNIEETYARRGAYVGAGLGACILIGATLTTYQMMKEKMHHCKGGC